MERVNRMLTMVWAGYPRHSSLIQRTRI